MGAPLTSHRWLVAGLFVSLASCSGEDGVSEPSGSSGSRSTDGSDEQQSGSASSAGSGGFASSASAGAGGFSSGGASTGGSSSGGASSATGGETADGVGLGLPCESSDNCASEFCDDGICLTHAAGCEVSEVEKSPGNNWSDSYSADGKCYCATTFDHSIGVIVVDTPVGKKTVQEICDAVGPGPGIAGNPVYNDVQCGNGPANDAGDEDYCPGRVDQRDGGCCTVGPTWDLSVLGG